jgi:hypothetical protein
MNPWYFMNISIEDNADGLGLEKFGSSYPNGNWSLVSDEGMIIYNNKKYTRVDYDNKTKTIRFYADTWCPIAEITLHLKLE